MIRVLESQPTQVQGVEVYASAAKWLQAENLKTPRPIFNVVIVKYQGSEYFRAAAWIDPALVRCEERRGDRADHRAGVPRAMGARLSGGDRQGGGQHVRNLRRAAVARTALTQADSTVQ